MEGFESNSIPHKVRPRGAAILADQIRGSLFWKILAFGFSRRDFTRRPDSHEPGIQILQGPRRWCDLDVRGHFYRDRISHRLQQCPVIEFFGRACLIIGSGVELHLIAHKNNISVPIANMWSLEKTADSQEKIFLNSKKFIFSITLLLISKHHAFDLHPALSFSHINSFKRDNFPKHKRRGFEKEQIPWQVGRITIV